MPRMGGEEAFRRLREMRSDLPIIMMSGYTEGSITQRLTTPGTGPTGFLQKPFLAEELVALLRQFAEVAG
jgi:two-component system cell cycle sensor histidine kinase/response regulator CckA